MVSRKLHFENILNGYCDSIHIIWSENHFDFYVFFSKKLKIALRFLKFVKKRIKK